MTLKIKITLLALFFVSLLNAQKLEKDKSYFLSAIGFWNVENLYDTLNDQWKNDEDFTPAGTNAWNGSRYRTKIDHLGEVISQMATDVTPDGLAILGMCEIENKSVVQFFLLVLPILKFHKVTQLMLQTLTQTRVKPISISLFLTQLEPMQIQIWINRMLLHCCNLAEMFLFSFRVFNLAVRATVCAVINQKTN